MSLVWFFICALSFAVLEQKQGIEGHVILRGIPAEMYGVDLRLWGRWLLIFVPVLLDSGLQLYRKFLQKEMTLHRYQTWKAWWKEILIQQCVNSSVYVLILEVLFWYVIADYGGADVIRTTPLLIGHSIFLNSLLLWIYSRGGDIVHGFFLVVLGEGLGMILPASWTEMRYAPWFWGMWEYSVKEWENSVRLVVCIIAELFLTFAINRSVIRNRKWIERK
jgi:hypothetical protein